MTEVQYYKSIKTKEVQFTNFWQGLTYYTLPGICFFMSIMVITYHLIDFFQGNNQSFLGSDLWIIIIPTILGFLIYRFQKVRLKFQKIETRLTWGELHFIIEDVAKQLQWETLSYNEFAYIGVTYPGFFSGSLGEQVTVIFGDGYILVNSINNPNNRSGTLNIGQNKLNRETFINRIKAEGY